MLRLATGRVAAIVANGGVSIDCCVATSRLGGLPESRETHFSNSPDLPPGNAGRLGFASGKPAQDQPVGSLFIAELEIVEEWA